MRSFEWVEGLLINAFSASRCGVVFHQLWSEMFGRCTSAGL